MLGHTSMTAPCVGFGFCVASRTQKNEMRGFSMLARKLRALSLSFALWSVSEEEMQMDFSCSSEQKQGWSRSRSPVGVAEELVNLMGWCSSLPLTALQGMLQQP